MITPAWGLSASERVLVQVPLLAALDASQRSELCKALKPRMFNAGEIIVRKGEPGDFFYVVESGECVVLGDSGQACSCSHEPPFSHG